jgi:dipeptidyl aminopeptidase/acylaminoacyl peptidase
VGLRRLLLTTGLLTAAILSTGPAVAQQPTRSSIHASGGVPVLPASLEATVNRYRFLQSAHLEGWLAATRQVLYLTTTAGTQQAFVGRDPGVPGWQLTDTGSPVGWVYSHPRLERVIIAEDADGNEKHRLTLFDLSSGLRHPFTNGNWENNSVLWSRSGQLVALTSNSRNGKDGDLYVVDPMRPGTGRKLKDATGTMLAQSWSPDNRRLAAVEHSPDSRETRVQLVEVATGHTETLPQPPGTQVKRLNVRWSPDGHSLYWLTDRDSEFLYLAKFDLATATETRVTEKIRWGIDLFSLSDDGSAAVLIVNEDGRSRLLVIDPRTGRELPAPRIAEGIISSAMFQRGTLEFAFEWSCAQSPPGVYACDLATGRTTEWIRPDPVDPVASAQPSHVLFRYPSFDGRLIPAYVRRPDPKFRGPRPVLVLIHGGPAAHYSPGFSLLENYLLGELGLVLVMPNIRGSTGYGNNFERLDNGRLRPDAVRDLGALLDWISTQPDWDASRVAVSGGSHGGYLALAMMAEFGDRLRAGIDIAGFSDFETSLKDERPSAIDYWRAEYGDERDPETRKFMRSISPLTHADRIKKPLLVVHAKNDPRVKIDEADQIVSAVQRNGTLVWYVWFDADGHNLGQRVHAEYELETQIVFLKTFLLGH